MQLESNAAAILAKLDRSSPDKLLASLTSELVLLHQSNAAAVARIAALEAFQSISDRVLESDSSIATELAKSVWVEAAFSLSAENGFYGLEHDANGVPYRWTGPEPTFYFELLLDRSSPATLSLRFLKIFRTPSPEKVLRCFVDGQPVAVQTRAIDGEFELNAAIPHRKAGGASVIAFLCSSMQSPLTAGVSQDRRCLGLAFRWLKIDRTTAENNAAVAGQLVDTKHKQDEDVVKLELVQSGAGVKQTSSEENIAKLRRS